MFSKAASKPGQLPATTGASSALPAPSQTAEPSQRRGPAAPSLIAEDVTLEGGISGEGELHVDGTIRGDIRVARISIGETGRIEGSVTAEAIECRGRVVGALIGKQIKLYGTAHVDGDVTHEQLSIENGAFFQGRSLKLQRATPAVQPTSPVPTPTPPSQPIVGEVVSPSVGLN